VRRPLDAHDRVRDRQPPAGEFLLELGLVVDVPFERVVDPLLEGLDDRPADNLEAVLEVDRSEAGFDERGEDVAVRGQPQELVGVDLARVAGEEVAQPQALPDDRAALARDDVRADLGETAFGLVGKAVVELLRDREPENAVAEELQPLVRVRTARRPRGMRECVLKALARKRLDQSEELAPRLLATGGRRCSRLPARRSGSAGRPRPRS
jgi:hypothetical protein